MADMSFNGGFHTARRDASGLSRENRANRQKNIVKMAGAAVSLSLVLGVVFWGYRLAVRDVTGIPVLKAELGEMRVRPDNPGGEIASNRGFAVNRIAESGTASGPADRLLLAPQPMDLTSEDVAFSQQSEAIETTPPARDSLALLEQQLDAGRFERVSPEPDTSQSSVLENTDPSIENQAVEPSQANAQTLPSGALSRSVRPRLRPERVAVVASLQLTPPPAAVSGQANVREIDPASLPSGTRLIQLGAFNSAELAETEWDRLTERYARFIGDRARVIQQAQSGGRTFYRLRAYGFENLAEARRICAALEAEGADCIPVVTR